MKHLFLSLLLTASLFAINNYNKGVDAYNNSQHELAIKYWMPYAVDHDNNAQYLIANIYYEGKADVMQDYDKAMSWYKKAAKDGNAKANLKIALMYIKGEGMLKSFKNAVPYVKKAYESECSLAQDVWEKYKLYNYE